jgi:hypothetical protein
VPRQRVRLFMIWMITVRLLPALSRRPILWTSIEFASVGNIDVVNASSEAENNVPSTRPTKAIVRKESVQGTHVQPQPATRSSARIRTKRDLQNPPDAVPQQKKRKRGESGELAATATVTKTSSLLPTDNVDKKHKEATPLTIRIPVMKFNRVSRV